MFEVYVFFQGSVSLGFYSGVAVYLYFKGLVCYVGTLGAQFGRSVVGRIGCPALRKS